VVVKAVCERPDPGVAMLWPAVRTARMGRWKWGEDGREGGREGLAKIPEASMPQILLYLPEACWMEVFGCDRPVVIAG